MVELNFRDLAILRCAEDFFNEWGYAPSTEELTVQYNRWLDTNNVGSAYDRTFGQSVSMLTQSTNRLRLAGLMVKDSKRNPYTPTEHGKVLVDGLTENYTLWPVKLVVENGSPNWETAEYMEV